MMTADIPDVVLVQPNPVQCYIYVMNETSGITVYQIDMPLVPRAEPSDIYTPRQIDYFADLESRLDDLFAESTELKDGLDTLTTATNNAKDAANAAAADVTAATNRANQAAQAAETGAANVNAAIEDAEDATEAANQATADLETLKTQTQAAADNANAKATLADQKAALADQKATDAQTAASAANTAAANATNGVKYIGTAYSEKPYAVNDLVIHDGKYYICTTAIETGESWNSEHWTETDVSEQLKDQWDRVNDLAEIITERTGIQCFLSATAPSTSVLPGDLWIDTANNYRLKRYTGVSWQDVYDTRIDDLITRMGAAETNITNRDTRLKNVEDNFVQRVNNIAPVRGNVTLPTDSAPVQGSENYVTSGGVYSAIEEKIPATDAVPTSGSQNLVKSGGVYQALQGKVSTVNEIAPDAYGNVAIPVDSTP